MAEPLQFHNEVSPFGQDNIIVQHNDNQNNNNNYNPASSKLIQALSQQQSGEQLVKFFEQYEPESDFNISQLNRSAILKLKKYKECVYYGEFLNSKRQGKGIMAYHNGRVYEGSWENDFKHGKGYERFSNNSKYEGAFMNGKPEGLGTYFWANGQSYQGQWVNGLKHGSGMWRGSRGDSYIGEWKFGKADGYGVHTWLNGDKYQGEFKACLKHGQGTQKFGNGDLYVGSYVNGKPSGYGEYYWSNGSFFKGSFKNGLRHGDGIWKRNSGQSDKYQGSYANDKKCGYGIFTWASGNVYKGNYFDDVRHGFGQMYWNDGSCYKGNWQKGIQHGQGEILIPGQQPRKGVFQSNVLVQVNNQSPISNLKTSQRQQSDFGIGKQRPLSKQINSKLRLSSESDKFSTHSKGYPPPYPGKGKLILRSGNVGAKQNQTQTGLLFKTRLSFNPHELQGSRQNKSSNRIGDLSHQFHSSKFSQTKIQPKQKIPHSSFYLHQITKNSKRPYSRDTTHLSLGRQSKVTLGGESNSNHRVRRIQTGIKRNDMNQQIKTFANQKAGYLRRPSRSIKS